MSRSIFTADYRRLCQVLIQARETEGITQAALAARLQRPQSFVSKYERSERRLDVVEFLEVVEALCLDPCEVIKAIKQVDTNL